MLSETVVRLAEIPNIIGIKDATGDLDRGRELIESCPEGFAIYSGDDGTALELILMGGHGDISVTANVAPQLMSEMCRLGLAGDAEAARKVNAQLEPVHEVLFVESNPIPVKWAVAEMGLMQRAIRLPLTELSSHYHDDVRAALKQAKLLN